MITDKADSHQCLLCEALTHHIGEIMQVGPGPFSFFWKGPENKYKSCGSGLGEGLGFSLTNGSRNHNKCCSSFFNPLSVIIV